MQTKRRKKRDSGIRAFITLEIPLYVKEELLKKIKPFEDKIKGRMAGADSIHLTLKFLGSISPDEVVEALGILEEAASRFPAFEASFAYTGGFPERRPRVLWAGAGYGAENISEIAEFISKRVFKKIGIDGEKRKFVPHVTLWRLRGSEVPQEFFELKFGLKFTADSLCLMRSELEPAGARYTELGRFKLK